MKSLKYGEGGEHRGQTLLEKRPWMMGTTRPQGDSVFFCCCCSMSSIDDFFFFFFSWCFFFLKASAFFPSGRPPFGSRETSRLHCSLCRGEKETKQSKRPRSKPTFFFVFFDDEKRRRKKKKHWRAAMEGKKRKKNGPCSAFSLELLFHCSRVHRAEENAGRLVCARKCVP